MTLLRTVREIERAAMQQPPVKMIVENDIFRLNGYADARYGVFGWTQGQHAGSPGSSLMRYAFALFYVDRLTESGDNRLEIQSVGIQTIENVIRGVAEAGIEAAGDYRFTAFNQRFMDECAGVFCNVEFEIPADGLCYDTGADMSDDFSPDFLIY